MSLFDSKAGKKSSSPFQLPKKNQGAILRVKVSAETLAAIDAHRANLKALNGYEVSAESVCEKLLQELVATLRGPTRSPSQ